MKKDKSKVKIRQAKSKDISAVVKMLSDDSLGQKREKVQSPLSKSYITAFDAIADDGNNKLIVACRGPEVVGCLQLTFIPNITYQGGWRAQIEGVRVRSDERTKGIGERMFKWAIDHSLERSCHLVQLTTNKARPEAIQFYKKLGFNASHEGMKLNLTD